MGLGGVAEREGFEPSKQVAPLGGLANRCTRPLCDLSVVTARAILSWATVPTDRCPTTTETELQAITVGPVQRLTERIELAESDPAWTAPFDREAARIRSLLGDDVRRRGELPAPTRGGRLRPRIREPDWHEHRVCKGPDTRVNLHIFSVGSPEIPRMLGFRDRLRTHADEFDRYLAAKRELAGQDGEFVQQYADAKSEVVEAIVARALAEPGREADPR